MDRIIVFVVVLVCVWGCVTSSPKTHNVTGLSDEMLATVVCKKRKNFLDSNFAADIQAVYGESGEKVMGAADCSDSMEKSHRFQPGKYVFVVLCSQGSAAYAYPQVPVELKESRSYLISCTAHNKKTLGIEFFDKVSATITELN